MRKFIAVLLIVFACSETKAQWAVIDAPNLQAKLIQIFEVFAQIDAWYDQAQTFEGNLQALSSGHFSDLFGYIIDNIETEKGEYFLNDLLRLDPDSAYFEDALLDLVSDALGSIDDGRELGHMYSEFPVPEISYHIDQYESQYKRFVDRRKFYAGVEKASIQRLQDVDALQGTAQSLSDEDEMKALQVLIAQNAAILQSLEQLINMGLVDSQSQFEREVKAMRAEQIAIKAAYYQRRAEAEEPLRMDDELDDALRGMFGGGQ